MPELWMLPFVMLLVFILTIILWKKDSENVMDAMKNKFDVNKINCTTCNYQKECEKHNGKKRDDGDDYTALKGTHHCRASWDGFGK